MAPFELHVRCHVSAGAMLTLERAVILADHQVGELVHEALIALDLLGPGEILREHKMQVAFHSVAEDDCLVVAMFPKQSLQIQCCGRQLFHREHDILDDDYRSGLAHGANRGIQAFSYVPQLGVLL